MSASLIFKRSYAAAAAASSSSPWSKIQMAPADPILGITVAFLEDKYPIKVNLGAGTYKDNSNKPWVLPSVREAEKKIYDAHMNHEYLPIQGLNTFNKLAAQLAFGDDSKLLKEGRIVTTQALSGTGALRVGAAFLAEHYNGGAKDVFVPDPTWSNHHSVFQREKFTVHQYKYYDAKTRGLDMNGLMQALQQAPSKSVFLLHACAHNPTVVDPTEEQWKQICETMKKKNHFAFLDSAYQGFATGDVVKDSFALHQLIKNNVDLCLSQSFAKNMGLYGERIGAFHLVTGSTEESARVQSQLNLVVRAMISSPPLFGARIVETVLGNESLKQQWLKEVKVMADRIKSMRQQLKDGIKASGSTHNWDHITNQIGMFAYTGLTAEQCDRMRSEFHVYLTRNGRISIAWVNTNNVKYVADAIHAVTK